MDSLRLSQDVLEFDKIAILIKEFNSIQADVEKVTMSRVKVKPEYETHR